MVFPCLYRSTTKILKLVNQLREQELPLEYANVQVSPSHDVEGPEVTALSILNFNQAGHLRVRLCDQLQKEFAANPSQVKMIYLSSTKKIAKFVTSGTVFEDSLTSINDFQGCEAPLAVVFLGSDSDYSQVVEMCSRAQYKLIIVICESPSLHKMIAAKTHISVEDISEKATNKGNIGISLEQRNLEADVDNNATPLEHQQPERIGINIS